MCHIVGGHVDVVQLLAREYADVNSTDNRGVSCLMTSFRKGHVKVVKWLVKHVSQFPPDSDCKRFIQTLTDKVSTKLFFGKLYFHCMFSWNFIYFCLFQLCRRF